GAGAAAPAVGAAGGGVAEGTGRCAGAGGAAGCDAAARGAGGGLDGGAGLGVLDDVALGGAWLGAVAPGRRTSARTGAGSAPGRRLACAAWAGAAGVVSACWRSSRCASSTRRSTSSSAWGTGRRVERT